MMDAFQSSTTIEISGITYKLGRGKAVVNSKKEKIG
jgi:hypothetical protein